HCPSGAEAKAGGNSRLDQSARLEVGFQCVRVGEQVAVPAARLGSGDIGRIVVDEEQFAARMAKALLGNLVDRRFGLGDLLDAGNHDIPEMVEERFRWPKLAPELGTEIRQREE